MYFEKTGFICVPIATYVNYKIQNNHKNNNELENRYNSTQYKHNYGQL